MTSELNYKKYLENKTVAVVGPSRTATMQENGAKIDACDVVVRVNNMLEVEQEYQKYLGSRTDVVYATLDDPPHTMVQACVRNRVKFLSSSYPKNEWFFQERMARNVAALKTIPYFSTVTLPEDPYWEIKRSTSSRPNTGFSAIIDLLSSDLKELYIVGIDFYRSAALEGGQGYYDGYNCQWTEKRKKDFINLEYDGPDRHDPDSAFKYFKHNMYLKDDRIVVDPIFETFLRDKKYEDLANLFVD